MAYLPDSEAEFRDAIAAAVQAALPSVVEQSVRRALRNPLMTGAEVCALLGWSKRKLAYAKADRKLPFMQRGRTVLYPRDAVEAFLAEGYVPAKWSDATSNGEPPLS